MTSIPQRSFRDEVRDLRAKNAVLEALLKSLCCDIENRVTVYPASVVAWWRKNRTMEKLRA